MYARAVDQQQARLRELRQVEIGDLGVGALALALAVAATQTVPSLALPLFFGGIVVGGLGLRALWERWDMVDRLAGEPAAYVISEVRAYACAHATIERRRSMACAIRSRLRQPAGVFTERIEATRDDLNALAAELDDASLELEPSAAVACTRLLRDPGASPLLNPELGVCDLRAHVLRVRSGFSAR